MTPQERAAADDMYNRLISVMHNGRYADQAKERLALFYRVTRRAALLEAASLIKLMPMLTAHNVAAVLDRLASEGG